MKRKLFKVYYNDGDYSCFSVGCAPITYEQYVCADSIDAALSCFLRNPPDKLGKIYRIEDKSDVLIDQNE